MVTPAEVEILALNLPESDRAKLAANLLNSLPGVRFEEDKSHADAVRRAEEKSYELYACLAHDKFFEVVGLPVLR
jgi:hypothetical protein